MVHFCCNGNESADVTMTPSVVQLSILERWKYDTLSFYCSTAEISNYIYNQAARKMRTLSDYVVSMITARSSPNASSVAAVPLPIKIVIVLLIVVGT